MRQWIVDAFAERAFEGNPAGVVEPLDQWPDERWMQAVAMENNQAETAFLRRTAEPGRFDLRWFTPAQEVDLCGHATLASAHVLFTELSVGTEDLAFETRSGPLYVRRLGDQLEMDFPADRPRRTEAPNGLAEALGAEPTEVWAGRYLVAVLGSAEAVRRLKPDIAALKAMKGEASEAGHVIICAPADAGEPVEVVDRFFAPGCGVDEDPATGSAHCILGPLYAEKLGQPTVRFLQAYPGRGGRIETEDRGGRVLLRGRAVTVVEGRLRAAP